jgi:hypothetical protein
MRSDEAMSARSDLMAILTWHNRVLTRPQRLNLSSSPGLAGTGCAVLNILAAVAQVAFRRVTREWILAPDMALSTDITFPGGMEPDTTDWAQPRAGTRRRHAISLHDIHSISEP